MILLLFPTISMPLQYKAKTILLSIIFLNIFSKFSFFFNFSNIFLFFLFFFTPSPEDYRGTSAFAKSSKVCLPTNKSNGSFQNILRLSLNARVEKKMFSEESIVEKNIKFRDEKDFVDSENCEICQIAFQILKLKHFWFFILFFYALCLSI